MSPDAHEPFTDDEIRAVTIGELREHNATIDAWLATKPLTNENAPLTPFVLPQYILAAEQEAARLDADAEISAAEVRRNIQRASNYILGVVLFSIALFFAGMSAKLTQRRSRVVLLGVGCTVFLGTLLWVATSPVNLSV